MIKWRSTTQYPVRYQVKEMEVGLMVVPTQNPNTSSFLYIGAQRDNPWWRTPENPLEKRRRNASFTLAPDISTRRNPLEKRWRAPGVPPTPIRWRSARSSPPSRNRSRWRPMELANPLEKNELVCRYSYHPPQPWSHTEVFLLNNLLYTVSSQRLKWK